MENEGKLKKNMRKHGNGQPEAPQNPQEKTVKNKATQWESKAEKFG